MRTHSSTEMIVHAWDSCQLVPEWQRAAALLAAFSRRTLEETLKLGIARRDSRLVEWRVVLFGPKWVAFANCPNCTSMLEYEIPVDTAMAPDSKDELDLEVDRQTWRVRWPSTLDLIEAASAGMRAEGRDLLIHKCIPDDAPPSTAIRLIEALGAQHYPFASVKLSCCECGKVWEVIHDIGEFLWREVCAAAKRLLREVDVIARAYGWTEREILALSQNRRNFYLEVIR